MPDLLARLSKGGSVILSDVTDRLAQVHWRLCHCWWRILHTQPSTPLLCSSPRDFQNMVRDVRDLIPINPTENAQDVAHGHFWCFSHGLDLLNLTLVEDDVPVNVAGAQNCVCLAIQ